MKIDPITYEVNVAAGVRPLYVWEAPVRAWHWATALLMFVMIVTGFLIGRPLISNLGETWNTYDMSYLRGTHFMAGMLFTVFFLGRLYWGLVGNRYSRMILLPPLWRLPWWKGVLEQVKYYLFLRPHAPEYAGHNPLAQCAMFFMFTLASFGVILTGFALYAQNWGWETGWMTYFGWVHALFGDAQAVRTTHHALMYVFILFSIAHLYMSFREDVMGGATTISSMTTGLRMFKESS